MPEPIMVPVGASADVARVGPLAAAFARVLERRVQFVHVVHPDDDVDGEHRRFNKAVAELSAREPVPMSLDIITSSYVNDAVVRACMDHLTCMATSATPFRDQHYVGSCAASLLSRSSEPVVLVGPRATVVPKATSLRRVFLATDDHAVDGPARAAAEHFAHAFGDLPVATLTIDPDGVVYEQDYDDDHFDRPDTIHARMQPQALDARELGPLLARYAATGLLVVTTHARTGLAWICEGSVAFDAIAQATSPVVALGPAAVAAAV